MQGVGFRYFVQRAAANLRLQGYARNLADGSVEVYAMGSESALSEMSGLLRKGPPHADVRHVDESEAAPESVRGFEIRR